MDRTTKTQVRTYTVKKVNDFPVPSRDVTNQTLPGREWVLLATSRLGKRKTITYFYSVSSKKDSGKRYANPT